MAQNQITIIGAGIPGLTAALILADIGCVVNVVEHRALPTPSDIKPTTRTAAIMQGSLEVIVRTGVWDSFRSKATALENLTVIDDSRFPRGIDSMVKQTFASSEIGQDVFGYNVPLLDLTVALAERAKAHKGITIHENEAVTKDYALVTQADLVIGADGRNSAVRTWSGINATQKRYDQSAITCVISHTLPHGNTSTEFHRSGGPCTFVPHGVNQSAVVWVENHDDAEKFTHLPKQALIAALQERSRGVLGQIDLVVEPEMCPLMTLKADRLIAPKTLLMAEAAHVVSPIGAQGLNLSLRDVGAVIDMVENAMRLGQDIGSTTMLGQYERARRKDIMTRTFGIDRFHQLVANDNPLIAGLRRLGLKMVGLPSPIRGFMMEHGLSPQDRKVSRDNV